MNIKQGADAVYTFRFIRTLVLDWKNTDAYKLGLIDQNGKKLKSPETNEENNAYTFFHRVIFNIKRLFEKLPGSLTTKLSSYVAALRLLQEETGLSEQELVEMFERAGFEFEDELNENYSPLDSGSIYILNKSIPIYINESTDFEAEIGSKVRIIEEADISFGHQFYKAQQILSGRTLYITAHDVHMAEETMTVASGAVPNIPRPLKMPNGEKYQHFKVKAGTFNIIRRGRNKHQRWDKYLDLKDEDNQKMVQFAKKYRDATIVIEDETTGATRSLQPVSLGDYLT